MTGEEPTSDRHQIEKAIIALENQRAVLGDAVVDAALNSMRERLSTLVGARVASQQRKLATVLFMDVVDSTSMTSNLDPEETMELMDTALRKLAQPVYRYGGRVTRFMGDGLLALFGVPVAHENDAEMGIRAGLDMLVESQHYAREVKARSQIRDFSVRVGISTGVIMVGGETEAENTIMGSTVNLASRLESAAQAGTLLISGHTYRHVRGLFDVAKLDPVLAKGFDDPIQVYQVIRPRPLALRRRSWSVAGVEARMIGRDAELLMLQNLFRDTVEDGEAQIVTVVGNAGIGKSRLLHEFQAWIEMLPSKANAFNGRATPEMEASPFGLVRRMFAHRFGILESDSAAVVRRKFRSGMGSAINSDHAEFVGQMLGLDFRSSPAVRSRLSSDTFGEFATERLVTYFNSVANQPTVIFLEDIHWADNSSLDLVDYLVTQLRATKLLVVCLARSSLFVRRPNWGEGRETHRQIYLKPLSRRSSRALVREILQKVDSVPDELRDLIVEGAEGNPFYVEELIKMLMEDGVILRQEEEWRIELQRLAEIRVPPTLVGILQARLDSLPAREKQLLQRASVVGRLFWDAALVELTDTGGRDGLVSEEISSLLETIRERELIYQHEHSAFADSDEYIFKHALLRDVTYETVLLALRRTYHKQVARWLETAAGKRIGEYLGQIAGHFELAGEDEMAVKYLITAGDRARETYACQEAGDYYQRALALLEEQRKHDQAARTFMKLGLTYDLVFNYQEARKAYEQGFSLWERAARGRKADLFPSPHPLRLPAGDPTTLDPTQADEVISSAKIIQLFSGLVELRPDVGIVPDVAQSWEVLDSGKRYLFHLRNDVHWSDGTLVTARDFEYAWKRVLGNRTTFAIPRLLYDIKGARAYHQREVSDSETVGVRAIDQFTLSVELEGPTGYFLHLLANAVAFPVPRHVVELHGDSWCEPGNIVTCGPFRLEAWLSGKKMTLIRNPAYYGRFTGNIERVELLLHNVGPTASPETLEMYEADQLDVVDVTSLDVGHILQRHGGEYRKVPRLITMYVQFDASRQPFDDVRVRRAFVAATDREALVKAVRPDCYPATGGFVPPGMPGHSPGVGLPYDPSYARQLLSEAGYHGGQGFPQVECLTLPDRVGVGRSLRDQWRENLGVDVVWDTLERRPFFARLGESPPHLLILGWRADYPDPDDFLRVRVGDIRGQTWHDKHYDRLVEQAQRSLNQQERMELYAEAERILADQAPIMPIFYRSTRLLVKPWVTRFPTTGLREWFFKDVAIEPHEHC